MRDSPFKNEWIKCQQAHFNYLVQKMDMDTIATFYIILSDNNAVHFIQDIAIPKPIADILPEIVEEKRTEYLVRKGAIKKNKKQDSERKSKRKARPTKSNYFWNPDQGIVTDSDGNLIEVVSMIDAFPETIERKEG